RCAPRRPARDVRDLRQAPREARSHRKRLPGRGALLRDPGGQGGARARGSGERERHDDVRPERADRAQAGGRAAVSGSDQGGRDPRDARGGLCTITWGFTTEVTEITEERRTDSSPLRALRTRSFFCSGSRRVAVPGWTITFPAD